MTRETAATRLRVLILEDNPDDAALMLRELEREGLSVDCRCVDTEEEYVASLESDPDIILADYNLPSFDAIGALRCLKKSQREIPLIVVSGTIGEDLAVAAIREGASDYLLKDRLGRLGKAVVNAIAQSKLEREAHRVESERSRLSVLAGEVGLSLTSGDNLRAILRQCAEAIVRNLEAASVGIWTLNEAQGVLELQASAGMYMHLDGPYGKVPLGKYKIGLIAQERKPYLSNDILNDPRVGDKEWAKREGMAAFAGYPLIVDDRPVGVMALFAKHHLTDFTLQAMGSVASQIALGIRRKRDHEALLESNRTLESLIQASPLAVISLDSKGHVRSWNPAAERLFGWHLDEVAGARAQILESNGDEAAASPLAGAPSRVERKGRCKDGRSLDLDVWSEIIRNASGEPVGTVQILADISQRKAAERSLREAKEAAETASELKTRFLANMSHELRTPLTAILGYTEFLKQRLVHDLEGLEELEVVERNGQTLLELISDVLDLSKIEAERLEITELPCSPSRIIDQIVHDLALPARVKNLVIHREVAQDVPPVIVSDPVRLRQALTNLIGNAIKFTERGSVTVSVKLREGGRGRQLEFHVKDTGIGIPKEKLQCLFMLFTQVDSSSSRKYGGTGLGLSISFKIAQLLGGSLTVESEENAGSDFCLSLRCDVGQGLSDLAAPCTENGGLTAVLSGRVLVVEDNKSSQNLFRRYLEQAGCEVQIAPDGAAAVDECSRRDFDLILMDLEMPVLDGFQALARLRREGVSAPVIAFTAHAMKGDRESCLNAGFTSYISKPLRRDELLRCLEAFLKTKGERYRCRHALEQ